MRLSSAAVLALASTAPTVVFGFSSSTASRQRVSITSISSTVEPPERIAPNAGYIPDWEDRPGLSPEKFMASDMSKPDLSGMWECPLTRWDSEGIDVVEAQKEAAKQPHCPLEIRASEEDNALGADYFRANKEKIRQDLLKYGAIWFRGFELMKSVSGHREMYEAIELQPCLDPLHSSGLRKFSSERDALYEEVNKPSLRGHYIGLHSESTTKRTAAYAAFVCFQKATEGGGRFLVADGAAILGELDTGLLQKLYDRQIRISVSNIDLPPSFPQFVQDGVRGLVGAAVAPKFDMDLEMMIGADGKEGRLQVGSDFPMLRDKKRHQLNLEMNLIQRQVELKPICVTIYRSNFFRLLKLLNRPSTDIL